MTEKIKITTISDILNIVTEENKENFLRDFSNFLTINLKLKNLKINNLIISPKDFVWIDDGKNDIELEIKDVVIKRYGVDFTSSGGALTLDSAEVTEGREEEGIHSRTHNDGWTIKGLIHEDYYYWVNEFEAIHPVFGKVWGDFEHTVFADSEEGFQDFFNKHKPHEWDYQDI
jgi:hypothetical protein